MALKELLLEIAGIVFGVLSDSNSETANKVKRGVDVVASEISKNNERMEKKLKEEVKRRSDEELHRAVKKGNLENWQKDVIENEIRSR